MNNAGHKTTYAVIIVCVAAVLSAFILQRKPEIKVKQVTGGTLNASGITAPANTEINNADWSKVLSKTIVTLSTSSESKTSFGPDDFNPNLVTARMARDILSRYMQNSNSGQPLTTDQVTQIVEDTLSNPDYAKVDSVVYVASNLKTNTNNNSAGYKKYSSDFNKVIVRRMAELQNVSDPMAIMLKVAETDNRNDLKQLDIIISANTGLVDDLLKVQTPSSLVAMHLSMINSASATLSDLKAMKNIYTDPVSSLMASSQYEKHLTDLLNSLRVINEFFKKL